VQHLRDKKLRKGRKEEAYHIMTDIRNDHLSSASKRPNQLLRKLFRTGAGEVWRFAVQLGIDLTDVDIHEGDGFVVRSVESLICVKPQRESAIEVFGAGVDDEFGHGCLVGERSDEHDEGWTSTGGRAEGWKESPGQEHREEGVDSDLGHVFFLSPFVESMVHTISTKPLDDETKHQNLSGRNGYPPTLFTRMVTFNPSNLFAIPSKSIPALLASSRKYFMSWTFPVFLDLTLWISSTTFLSFFSFLPCKMRLNPLL